MKRLKIIFASFCVIITLPVGRIFYFSVIQNDQLTKNAVAQRTSKVTFTSPRGIIYDRNMIKITDSKMKLVVKNNKPYYIGNRTGNVLNHVIGYISADGKGTGIEGAFDYVLQADNNSTISYLKDINNNKISKGYSIKVDNSYKGISLTIDYHIQKTVEEAMDGLFINGAVIVADCKSGEILAMASRPDFNADNLVDYLDGTDGELLNKGILQYNPGSVFKIIVAAAFMENDYNEEMIYECSGKTIIDGMEFVCHKEEGHGKQNIEQAFANSCNCAFYEIGKMVGIDEIYKYSRDFGIGNEVLRINGIYEYGGQVPKSIFSYGDLANISIGQGDVMVTPLQIADVLCTICNGGVRRQLTLVRGIVDDKGICESTQKGIIGRVLSETTSRRMINLMNYAVSNGTGENAQIDFFGAGGKTGSAETGWVKDGKLMQQGWFAGYFPAENPQYVCVVIAENGESGSDSACPVFKIIAENMCSWYK